MNKKFIKVITEARLFEWKQIDQVYYLKYESINGYEFSVSWENASDLIDHFLMKLVEQGIID